MTDRKSALDELEELKHYALSGDWDKYEKEIIHTAHETIRAALMDDLSEMIEKSKGQIRINKSPFGGYVCLIMKNCSDECVSSGSGASPSASVAKALRE